jgi:hypothetical protein
MLKYTEESNTGNLATLSLLLSSFRVKYEGCETPKAAPIREELAMVHAFVLLEELERTSRRRFLRLFRLAAS